MKKKSVAFPHTINKQLENGGGGGRNPFMAASKSLKMSRPIWKKIVKL